MTNGLRSQLTAALTMRLSGLGVNFQPGQIAAMVDDVETIIATYASSIQTESAIDEGQTPDPPQGE